MKPQPGPGETKDRSVSRLAELLEAAQTELQDLETDFQVRLRESILATEIKLKEQFDGELAARMKQVEEEARKANTRELLQRFEIEFQKLSAEFEERGKSSIAAAESAANLRLEQARAETERVRNDLQREVELAAGQWAAERQNLLQQIAKLGDELTASRAATASSAGLKEVEARLSEMAQQKVRLEDELRDSAARWNTERTRLKSDFDRSRQDLISQFDTQIQELQRGFEKGRLKEMTDSEAAAELRLRQALADAKEESERRERQIQATANESLQNATTQFEADRERLNRRAAVLEEELAKSREEQRARTPLSKELEAQLQEVIREKTELGEEFKEAAAAWKREREQLQSQRPAPAAGGRNVSELLSAEISRIEKSLSDISAKMKTPSLDLAAEIRLNQERIKLEHYLNGLRYSADGSAGKTS